MRDNNFHEALALSNQIEEGQLKPGHLNAAQCSH